jgi:hypothetical protein
MKQESISNPGSYSLYSVLGITNWVGEYIEDTIQCSGSPFNITNKITAPYFTKEEVCNLFGQYEKQESIKLEDGIIDHIFEQTEGSEDSRCCLESVLRAEDKDINVFQL